MRQIVQCQVTYCIIPLGTGHVWIDCRFFPVPLVVYRYDHEGD